MVDAAAEQWRPEAEEEVQAGLKAFTTMDILPPSNGHAAVVSTKEVANGHGFNKNGDVSHILEFDDFDANIDGTTTGKNEISRESSLSEVETGGSSKNVGHAAVVSTKEVANGHGFDKNGGKLQLIKSFRASRNQLAVVEEETVELEFEKVKPKLATHSMHCPNCNHEITKVILRRKVLSYRPTEPEPVPEPKELVGCFSCLSLFTCSDTGCFNPFDIFGKRPKTNIDLASPPTDGEQTEFVVRENESCFSMFWVFGKDKNNLKLKDPQEPDTVNANRQFTISSDQVSDAAAAESNTIETGTKTVIGADKAKKALIGGSDVTSLDQTGSSSATGDDDTKITIRGEPSHETEVVEQPRRRLWLGYEGVLAEILKSIVYGGLMEVIASLSVVASAAASDAATMSIVSLALASLVGGVFIIGHNIWDLRDDCYKGSSGQETNKLANNKYKELLGQVEYFPLHAFFAILSFLVFGMVPPVAYGFAFRETNDKDFTLVVVAAGSLLCVSLLAIFKAYISRCTVFEYFKTVVYYITTAVSVSGVSYVVGNLVTRLLEELGLFGLSSGSGMTLHPHSTTPSLAAF